MSTEHDVVAPEDAAPDSRRWLALAAIAAAQFMVVLDIAIVNVALPSIKIDLHFSQESLQWVITGYTIMFGGLLLLGGRLADIWGRRRLFMIGVGLFTAASLLNGLAWSESSLIAFRLVQGMGGALLSPAALSILTTTFTEGRERNLALGVWGAIAGSGAAAGTLLGGVITSGLGWSWIFFVNVPLGALVVVLSPMLLRESKIDIGHRKFDVAGAALVTSGLMLLVYAMTDATTHGWRATSTLVLLVSSVALLVAFVVVELRTAAPVVPFRIFSLRTLRGANITGFLIGSAVFSQFFLLSLYMQEVLGYSAMKTGVAYIASTLTIIVFAGVAQGLVTRFGVRPVLTAGLTLAAVAMAFYTRLPVHASYAKNLLTPFVIGGIGLGLSFVPMSIGALTGVPPRDAGLASGLINTSTSIGGAIGLAIISTVATTATTAYLRSHHSPLAFSAGLVHGFHVAFAVLVGIALLGVLAAAGLIGPKSEPETEEEPIIGVTEVVAAE